MKYEIGPQYGLDDCFRKAARLHQSRYRAEVLNVDFDAVTVYPSGNRHMGEALARYRSLLTEEGRNGLLACTFEEYIDALSGNAEIQEWQSFLRRRYIVEALEDGER